MENTKQYQYGHVSMEEVMKNIDEFIIPELQEPCKQLWNKNIFTFMVSNGDDNAYIIPEKLSRENQAIYDNAKTNRPDVYRHSDWRSADTITLANANQMTKQEITSKFLEFIADFKMQDVQKFLSPQEFLMHECDCKKETINPEYAPMQYPANPTRESIAEFLKHSGVPRTITEFDETKVVKPFTEYLREKGFENCYDPDEKKVFKSPFFLQRHLEYKEFAKGKKTQETVAEK